MTDDLETRASKKRWRRDQSLEQPYGELPEGAEGPAAADLRSPTLRDASHPAASRDPPRPALSRSRSRTRRSHRSSHAECRFQAGKLSGAIAVRKLDSHLA